MIRSPRFIMIFFIIVNICSAQFMDTFNKEKIEGWFTMTGDGTPECQFVQKKDYATLIVDGTKDKYNVYWTLIKKNVARFLDLTKFKNPANQLRVETKVRLHNAPRRVNLMINTNRTTDYHHDLMEYDIPDTTNWYVISLTTRGFDVKPGDSVYVQLCATDYGLEKYEVDIAYYRADIININEAGPDKGPRVPYHPAIPKVSSFSNHLNVAEDCVINSNFPDVNFNDLHTKTNNGSANILAINENQWGILRWDFSKVKDKEIIDAGLLELTTQSVQTGGGYIKAFGEDFGIEFGKIRVIEILGGDPDWKQHSVTYNSLIGGKKYSDVFNTQMIYDFDVTEKPGGKNYITISQPVLKRLINGTTKGLLIRPLGAITASFYSSENKSNVSPKLYMNLKSK